MSDMHGLIKTLLKHKIYLGTSSWKYPGWKNLVYRRHYMSEKEFEEKCLEEYAATYTAVGIDHTYYAWPLEKTLKRYAEQTPPEFRFGLKATERVTVFQFPKLKRYGKDAGKINADFLNPELFLENFIDRLSPIQGKIGVIFFEFSHFYPGMIASGSEFVERLSEFFRILRKESCLSFAVELRNQTWLKPEYFRMLQQHEIAHVFNSWTKMPSISAQIAIAKNFPLPFYPARLLLEPGMKYEQAVEAFSPYDKIQNLLPEVRQGAVELILHSLELGVPALVFVNNRCEGCAPKTIEGILEILSAKIGPNEDRNSPD